MALATPQLHGKQTPMNIPHLSLSAFSELVLPFLYPFLNDIDPRPTFILVNNENQAPSLLFANKAFQTLQRSCTVDIVQQCADLACPPARPTPIVHLQNGLQVHFHSIETTTLNGWFCFVEQLQNKPPDASAEHKVEENHIEDDPGKELVYTSGGLVRLDWTRGWCPMAIHDPEHFRFLREFDWASTPLGPYTKWSKSLRAIVNAIMPLKIATVIYYGEDALSIYNGAWKQQIAWKRHPSLMAQPLRQGWPDAFDDIYPFFRNTMDGVTTSAGEAQFLLNRLMESEETYFSFEFSPLLNDDGSFMGSLTTSIEHTDRVIKARRAKVTGALIEQSTYSKDLSLEGRFWDSVLEAIDPNPLDSPFAIIYRVEAWQVCTFIGGRGLPETPNDVFPAYFDLGRSPALDGFFQRQFRDLSTEKHDYLLVEFTPEQLEQLAGMRYRGFESCKSAVVIPLYQGPAGPPVRGFLVLGLNDRRPFDGSYKAWISELAQTLWKSVDIVWAKQEEARMHLEHFALVKIKTEEMAMALQKTTQELKESELLFARTADLIPVGLLYTDTTGTIVYANEAWYTLWFMEKTQPMDHWPTSVYFGDREAAVSAFTEAFLKKTSMIMEFRIGNDETPGSKGWLRWCRNSITPNFDEATGQLTGFVGTVVDITAAKDAAEYQRQLTIEAVESKRQQDNFIDVTSHELRNPLSAIMQSADEITQLLQILPGNLSQSTFAHDIEQAASTIFACGEYQKKIIDDILNVSKMDAGLLTVEPVPVQPHIVLQNMMKMFVPEFKAKGITSSFRLSAEYSEYCEQYWWSLDPARLTQITMNLVTNAVKFTATKAGIREVRVSLDASTKPPDFKDNFQSSGPEAGATMTAQNSRAPTPPPPSPRPVAHRAARAGKMNPENVIYLLVSVEDTGIGISEEWRAVMGQRYRQAPKTHISYGGSGLGLFIARQLAFLLDGELHFDSELGVGSTFSFYVRCEQCPPPEDERTSPSSLYSTSSFPSIAAAAPSSILTSSSSPTSPTSNISPPKRGQGMVILVVEDNMLNQTILRRQLEAQGCRVDVASNGAEALEILAANEQSPFTVVLMDMEMPVMDGVATTERIRAIERAMTSNKRHVPIIGTSANARMEHIDQMLLAGMDDVITKPFVVRELMSKMEHVLRVGQVAHKGDAIHEHTFLPYPTLS